MSQSTLPSSWWGSSLPTPKVRLNKWDSLQPFVVVDWYKYWWNTVWWQYSLYRYPEVVTMDLTDEQIEKWVWVEMLTYNKSKSPYWFQNEDAAYKVPVSRIGWVNTLWNLDTRWWGQSFFNAWPLAVDRPNHYQVLNRNEVIPVWQYLNNRMSQVWIQYNDASLWTSNVVWALTVAQWIRNSWPNYPWSKFWYSSRYRPLYFKFRYIMKADDGYSYISWPLTPTIKLCQEEHPFNFDAVASTALWITSHNINPLANPDSAMCWFETRLP